MVRYISAIVVAAAVFIGVAILLRPAQAEPTEAVSDATSSVVVAELFTSQSCSSCPPAERLFAKLSEQEDVITIEWHVDYWDDLVHGGSRWEDPYSSAEFTERQRVYNQALRGTRGVYTPQAVINGLTEGVGSRSSEVGNLLSEARALPANVVINGSEVMVDGTRQSADILFVRLLKNQDTQVKGGENKGRHLHSRNIALELQKLGETGEDDVSLRLPELGDNETCAVFVQQRGGDLGPVLGAARCG